MKANSEIKTRIASLYTKCNDKFIERIQQKYNLSYDTAADIVADAWMSILERIETMEADEAASISTESYIFAICKNLAVKHIDFIAKHPTTPLYCEEGGNDDIVSVTKGVEDWMHDDEEAEKQKKRRIRLMLDKLNSLNPKHRDLIIRHELGKESLSDLAKVLGYKSADSAKQLKAFHMKDIRNTVTKAMAA